MDFQETFTYLERLRKVDPNIGYHFNGDVLVIHREIWTVEGTAELFEQARQMFLPAED